MCLLVLNWLTSVTEIMSVEHTAGALPVQPPYVRTANWKVSVRGCGGHKERGENGLRDSLKPVRVHSVSFVHVSLRGEANLLLCNKPKGIQADRQHGEE